MAIIETDICSQVKGRIGRTIYYEVNGQKRARLMPGHYTDRKSPKQLAHRAKVKGVVSLYGTIDLQLLHYLEDRTKGTTKNAYNLFFSMNIGNMTEDGRIAQYVKTMWCQGDRSVPEEASATRLEDGTMEIRWSTDGAGANEQRDFLQLVLFKENAKPETPPEDLAWYYPDRTDTISLYEAKRSQGRCVWTLPRDLSHAKTLHLYGIFRDPVTAAISDSFYLGSFEVDSEQ